MDIIGKEDLDKMELTEEDLSKKKLIETKVPVMKEIELDKLSVEIFTQPVEQQKIMAAKIKAYIDYKMDKDLDENGHISEFTRKWVENYNELLDKIQKNLYGDKSVNLHLHKISHSQLNNEIRKWKENRGKKNERKSDEVIIDMDSKEGENAESE